MIFCRERRFDARQTGRIFSKNLSWPLNGEPESRFDARITAEASNAPPQPNRRENATRPSYWPCVTALHTCKGSDTLRRILSLFLFVRMDEYRKHRFEEAYERSRRGVCSRGDLTCVGKKYALRERWIWRNGGGRFTREAQLLTFGNFDKKERKFGRGREALRILKILYL